MSKSENQTDLPDAIALLQKLEADARIMVRLAGDIQTKDGPASVQRTIYLTPQEVIEVLKRREAS